MRCDTAGMTTSIPGADPRTRLLRRALLAVALGVMLWLTGQVLLLVFAAALVAIALRGGAEAIAARLHLAPRQGLGIVVAVLAALCLLLGFVSGPMLAQQGNELWNQLSGVAGGLRGWLQGYSWGRALLHQLDGAGAAPDGQIVGKVGALLLGAMGALGSALLVLAMALYFAATPRLYLDGALRLVPPPRRERAHAVLSACAVSLRHWLLGQGLSMLLITAAVYAGLLLIGVPLASLLALIAGVTNFVPYIGPVVGAVPALIVAFGEGLHTALLVGGLFVAVQLVEGNVIEPLLQKRFTDLPPAMTILSQTLFGTLFGIAGIVLATPILAVSLVAVRMLYIEDVLGDREPGTPDA